MLRWLRAALAAGLAAALPAAVGAADLRVLSAGALKPLVLAVAPAFERETGHRLLVDGDTAGKLMRRVQGGEAFDVVIVTAGGIEQLAREGRVLAGSAAPLARIGIGVAVRQGAPASGIGHVAGFKAALQQARAVAYIDPAAGGSSGIYLAQLFERLGVAAEVQRKAVLVNGGLVANKLLSSEADLALQQMSELLVVPGITVLGPLPEELQNYTTYTAAVSSSPGDAAAARALLARLVAPAARSWPAGHGMQAP